MNALRYVYLVLALTALPLAAGADGLPKDPFIQVSGHGELQITPDILHVSLTVEKTDKDVKVARADVESRTSKVIELARKLGVADRDIDAAALYVYPLYQWQRSDRPGGVNGQTLVGQHVTRSVYVTLRDISRYGDLLDGLVAAEVTRVDNVTPDLKDRQVQARNALQLAIADAHDNALMVAKSAGVTLGAVYSIAEQGGGYTPRPVAMAGAMRAASEAGATEYLPGQLEIDADVTVYYLIAH
jgi:hypothetical protein